jgi:hypothetical protein
MPSLTSFIPEILWVVLQLSMCSYLTFGLIRNGFFVEILLPLQQNTRKKPQTPASIVATPTNSSTTNSPVINDRRKKSQIPGLFSSTTTPPGKGFLTFLSPGTPEKQNTGYMDENVILFETPKTSKTEDTGTLTTAKSSKSELDYPDSLKGVSQNPGNLFSNDDQVESQQNDSEMTRSNPAIEIRKYSLPSGITLLKPSFQKDLTQSLIQPPEEEHIPRAPSKLRIDDNVNTAPSDLIQKHLMSTISSRRMSDTSGESTASRKRRQRNLTLIRLVVITAYLGLIELLPNVFRKSLSFSQSQIDLCYQLSYFCRVVLALFMLSTSIFVSFLSSMVLSETKRFLLKHWLITLNILSMLAAIIWLGMQGKSSVTINQDTCVQLPIAELVIGYPIVQALGCALPAVIYLNYLRTSMSDKVRAIRRKHALLIVFGLSLGPFVLLSIHAYQHYVAVGTTSYYILGQIPSFYVVVTSFVLMSISVSNWRSPIVAPKPTRKDPSRINKAFSTKSPEPIELQDMSTELKIQIK